MEIGRSSRLLTPRAVKGMLKDVKKFEKRRQCMFRLTGSNKRRIGKQREDGGCAERYRVDWDCRQGQPDGIGPSGERMRDLTWNWEHGGGSSRITMSSFVQ